MGGLPAPYSFSVFCQNSDSKAFQGPHDLTTARSTVVPICCGFGLSCTAKLKECVIVKTEMVGGLVIMRKTGQTEKSNREFEPQADCGA